MPGKRQNLAAIAATDSEAGTVNVIIETPRGSRTKLAYDERYGTFTLRKVLPQGMSFPFDFGFIPSTRGGDGDPLDVLVLIDEPVPSGTLVPCRLAGAIEARQTERDGTVEENDRLIAVAEKSILFADVKTLDDLPPAVAEQIEHFFINYNEQAGKRFEPKGRHGPRRAANLLDEGRKRFRSRSRK